MLATECCVFVGSNGPFHVISYYNHSWIVTFLGYHNIGGCSCSHDPRSMLTNQTTKTRFFPKHMITFSAGVTLVESCAGRKFGDVIT